MEDNKKPGFKESLKEALQYMGPALVASLSSKDPMEAYKAYNTALNQKRADEQLELNKQAMLERQERVSNTVDLQLQKLKMREEELALKEKAEQRRVKGQEAKLTEAASLTGKQTEKLASVDTVLANLDIMEKLSSEVDTGPLASRFQAIQSYTGLGDTQAFDQLKSASTIVNANYRKAMSGTAVSDAERKDLMSAIPNVMDDDERFKSKLKAFRHLMAVGGQEFLNAIAKGQPLKADLARRLIQEIPKTNIIGNKLETSKSQLDRFKARAK